jgi:outer membrane lipoprotein SlyB
MSVKTLGVVVLAGAAILGGCAYPEPYPVYSTAPVVTQRTDYGVVESIEMYRGGGGAPIGLGAIIGGIAGGIIGHQVERANTADRYRVIVRLDSGGTVALDQVGEGELRVGDRVRIVNRRVYRY